MDDGSEQMSFPLAATTEASLATAIRASSAIVVEKPSPNPNRSNQKRLPLRAKASAMASPMGKSPISSPTTKSANPNNDENKPNKYIQDIRKGLAYYCQLKNQNDEDYRKEVPAGPHDMQAKYLEWIDYIL